MKQLGVGAALRAAGVVGALTCGSIAAAAPANRFVVGSMTVTDLGTLGGSQSTALDVNDSGQIVGWAATALGIKHAFLSVNGTMTDVGQAFGPNGISEGSGINASGKIAGTMSDQFNTLGFVSDHGAVTMLFGPSTRDNTHATAINDNGDVCGADDTSHTVALWINGRLNGTPGVTEHANDINATPGTSALDFMVVLETSGPLGANGAPVPEMQRWDMIFGTLMGLQMVPPPVNLAPGDALAINNHGDVAGYSLLNASSSLKHAFFWNGVSASSQDLGVLPTGSNSVAEDVDEQRFIAGHADEHFVQGPLNITHERGFIYHTNFGMVPLPALPVTTILGSCRAYALNALSASMSITVVGACDTPSGAHAVRWDVAIRTVPIHIGP